MKKKIIYFLYSGYVLLLVGLLGGRFNGSMSIDNLNVVYGLAFILILVNCKCRIGKQPIWQLVLGPFIIGKQIKDKDVDDDTLLFKPLLFLLIPLIIVFAVNNFIG